MTLELSRRTITALAVLVLLQMVSCVSSVHFREVARSCNDTNISTPMTTYIFESCDGPDLQFWPIVVQTSNVSVVVRRCNVSKGVHVIWDVSRPAEASLLVCQDIQIVLESCYVGSTMHAVTLTNPILTFSIKGTLALAAVVRGISFQVKQCSFFVVTEGGLDHIIGFQVTDDTTPLVSVEHVEIMISDKSHINHVNHLTRGDGASVLFNFGSCGSAFTSFLFSESELFLTSTFRSIALLVQSSQTTPQGLDSMRVRVVNSSISVGMLQVSPSEYGIASTVIFFKGTGPLRRLDLLITSTALTVTSDDVARVMSNGGFVVVTNGSTVTFDNCTAELRIPRVQTDGSTVASSLVDIDRLEGGSLVELLNCGVRMVVEVGSSPPNVTNVIDSLTCTAIGIKDAYDSSLSIHNASTLITAVNDVTNASFTSLNILVIFAVVRSITAVNVSIVARDSVLTVNVPTFCPVQRTRLPPQIPNFTARDFGFVSNSGMAQLFLSIVSVGRTLNSIVNVTTSHVVARQLPDPTLCRIADPKTYLNMPPLPMLQWNFPFAIGSTFGIILAIGVTDIVKVYMGLAPVVAPYGLRPPPLNEVPTLIRNATFFVLTSTMWRVPSSHSPRSQSGVSSFDQNRRAFLFFSIGTRWEDVALHITAPVDPSLSHVPTEQEGAVPCGSFLWLNSTTVVGATTITIQGSNVGQRLQISDNSVALFSNSTLYSTVAVSFQSLWVEFAAATSVICLEGTTTMFTPRLTMITCRYSGTSDRIVGWNEKVDPIKALQGNASDRNTVVIPQFMFRCVQWHDGMLSRSRVLQQDVLPRGSVIFSECPPSSESRTLTSSINPLLANAARRRAPLSALGGIVTATVFASSASFSPYGAMYAQRLGGTTLMYACQDVRAVLEGDVDVFSSPTRLGLGPQVGYRFRGAIVGNVVLMWTAGATVVSLWLMGLKCWKDGLWMTPRTIFHLVPIFQLWETLQSCGAPGMFVCTLFLPLLQPTISSSATLLSNDPTAVTWVSDAAISIVLGLAVSGVAAAGLAVHPLLIGFLAESAKLVRSPAPQDGRLLVAVAKRLYHYFFKDRRWRWRQKVVNDGSSSTFVAAYGQLFEGQRKGAHWWILVEALLSVVCAVLCGVCPGTRRACVGLLAANAVVQLLLPIAIVLFWPHDARYDALAAVVLSCLAASQAVGAFIAFLRDDNDSDDAFATLSMVVGALSLAVVIPAAPIKWFNLVTQLTQTRTKSLWNSNPNDTKNEFRWSGNVAPYLPVTGEDDLAKRSPVRVVGSRDPGKALETLIRLACEASKRNHVPSQLI